jgi:phosphate starvation-inducible PhoH-like protein
LAKREDSIKQFNLPDNALALRLFGKGGDYVRRFEELLGVKVDTRGTAVTIQGDPDGSALAESLMLDLYALLEKGYPLTEPDIDYALRIVSEKGDTDLSEVFMDTVYVSSNNKNIAPKSLVQKTYLDAIRSYDIAFGIGPAGTGKTFLAIAAAARALADKEVDRIILTRPAVEAGESLGFLPGDMAAKIDPYLRPLYDALHSMMDLERVQTLQEQGVIEVAPLAFMRGRTLDDSFVILDEAQNTTVDQMKMFLTRLGFGSKAVVTGDITQIDLPNSKRSGLVASQEILKDVDKIKFVYFSDKDVVRHPLVQEVIKAFDLADRKKSSTVKEK